MENTKNDLEILELERELENLRHKNRKIYLKRQIEEEKKKSVNPFHHAWSHHGWS